MNDTTMLITSINTCKCRKSRHCFLFPQETAFSSHDNHGTGVVLSDDKHTAERTSRVGDGIVLSRDPMVENTVYEVNNQSVMSWQ